MLIRQALPLRRPEPTGDSPRWLRHLVETLAEPRHATFEAYQNRQTATFLAQTLDSYGYRVQFQGPHRNVLALPADTSRPLRLVCAHYDSVPSSPGADDNASALAVLLGTARSQPSDTAFIAFNREEDGMVGSFDFVEWLAGSELVFTDVHVLEMVGYTDPRPGAQRVPAPIPSFLAPRDTGDFIGLVGLGAAHHLAAKVRRTASGALGVPPVVSLQAPCACLHIAPDLGRSDHLPFVQAGLRAVMWTDTADFRTPHYHQLSDTPDTLDYGFMSGVQRLLELSLAA